MAAEEDPSEMSGQYDAYSVANAFAGAARRARALARKIERSRDRAGVGADVHGLVSDVEQIAVAAREIADGLVWSRATHCMAVFHSAIRRAKVLRNDLEDDFNLEINREAAVDHVQELARALRDGEREALRIAHAEAPRPAKTSRAGGRDWASSRFARSAADRILAIISRLLRHFGRR